MCSAWSVVRQRNTASGQERVERLAIADLQEAAQQRRTELELAVVGRRDPPKLSPASQGSFRQRKSPANDRARRLARSSRIA